ncbi:MAG: AAA family ATPase [Flavobacteriales bacterium]|nr:AAA family ATPase [Flavobacteriales bacterium]
MPTRNYIITGGPSTGKTSVIDALNKRGYNCYGEVARSVIIEESRKGSDALPYINNLAFTEKVVNVMCGHLRKGIESEINFFDRGLPDSAGYLIFDGIDIPAYLIEEIRNSNYEKTVFIAPFWEEIYINDSQRFETAEKAKGITNALRESYTRFGFNLVEIPTGNIEERADFVLSHVLEYHQ